MKSGGWSAQRYEPARERAWHLSMLVDEAQCAWCAHDAGTGEAVALHWSEGIAALDSDALPFHPVTTSFLTLPEWSALVPEAALVPGREADHLRLVHGRVPTGALRSEAVERIGAICVYLHDDELERAVLDRFPSARPVPMQSLMARGALARSAEGPALLIHRGHDRLDAAVADRGRLLLSNAYPARSSQDSLYFTLLAIEGAGLEPASLRLHSSGTHLSMHERDLLQRFVPKAGPAIEPWPGHLHPPGQEPHRWLALLEQFACAS